MTYQRIVRRCTSNIRRHARPMRKRQTLQTACLTPGAGTGCSNKRLEVTRVRRAAPAVRCGLVTLSAEQRRLAPTPMLPEAKARLEIELCDSRTL